MSVFFLRRGKPNPPAKVNVSVTGTGNATYCYATINGTKRSAAATGITVRAGNKITFAVYGRSTTYYGAVTIDGTEALRVTNQTTRQYEWTVPDNITSAVISLSYTSSSSQRRGRITVTTA